MNKYLNKNEKFSAELKLLIYSLHIVNDRQRTKLEKLLKNSDINWNCFLKLVTDRHRLTGPVYKNLIQYGKASIPESVLSQLKKQYRQNAYQMLSKTAELVKLTSLFKKNGIRALPYKGPVLGMLLYGDLSMRRSTDLDIVIPVKYVSHAEKILIESGYTRIAPRYELTPKQQKSVIRKGVHSSFLHPINKINVELHWKFFPDHICSVDFDDIWQNRQMIKIGENFLPSCSLEDYLILLLIHGGKHSWRRLFWLNDIVLILNRFTAWDWETFMNRVRQLGINRPAVSALLLLEHLFDLELPHRVHELAGNDKKTFFLVQISLARIMESDEANKRVDFPFFDVKEKLSSFFFLPHLRYKLSVVLTNFFPNDFEYLALPDRFFFLYYPLRPTFWFFRKFTKIKPVLVSKDVND